MKELTKKQIMKDCLFIPGFVFHLVFAVLGILVSFVYPFFMIADVPLKDRIPLMIVLIFFFFPIFGGFLGLYPIVKALRIVHLVNHDEFTVVYDTVTKYERHSRIRKVYLQKYTRETSKVYPIMGGIETNISAGNGVYLICLHGNISKMVKVYFANECRLSKELEKKLF